MIKPLKIITDYEYHIEINRSFEYQDDVILYYVKKDGDVLSSEYSLERALKYIAKLVLLDKYVNEEFISIEDYTSELIALEDDLLRN